jgi:hypothetical protein
MIDGRLAFLEYVKLREAKTCEISVVKTHVKCFNAVPEADIVSLLSTLVESDGDSADGLFQ